MGDELVTIATTEPTRIVRGNTAKWTKELAEYLPADSWVLRYYFADASNRLVITATNNGDGRHLVTLAIADTTKLPVGRVHWQATVTKSGETFDAGAGVLEVVEGLSLSTAGGVDLRSVNRKALDAIEARLAGKTDWDTLSVTLPNGRSVARLNPRELREERDYYAERVAAEEASAAGVGSGRQILGRFG